MRKTVTLLTVLTVCLAGSAMASTIFDLSPTNGTTSRSADSGPGQGVIVDTTTTINNMAFFMNAPNGADVKFMIWGNNDTNLLFSQTDTLSASGTQAWVSASPFSFTLQAGQEYWFGVIADNSIDVGYIFPPITYFENGLTADNTGNSNYINFADPTVTGNGGAEIGLRLFGGTTTTPEPGSLILLGSGILGIAGTLRRRFQA
jgi:hypothetical protein